MNAIVVTPDRNKSSYWLVQERITPLITSEQTNGAYELVLVEAQPRGGPPPHIHRREDELFYVIDGTFDFAFEDHVLRAGPGDAVFLPRDILHTYNNAGEEVGHLLVAATPANFARFVADAGRPCRDPEVLPQTGPSTFWRLADAANRHGIELQPTWKPSAAAPSAAKRRRELWVIGQHIRLLLTSPQTRRQFSLVEITTAPGEFVPPHRHLREDEFFYVLEGTYEFEIEGRRVCATPGTLVFAPKNTLHGFGNSSDRPAKLVDYHTPGGFENFFIAAGTQCTDIALGPPQQEPDFEQLARIAFDHGMELAPRQPVLT